MGQGIGVTANLAPFLAAGTKALQASYVGARGYLYTRRLTSAFKSLNAVRAPTTARATVEAAEAVTASQQLVSQTLKQEIF